MKKYYCDICLNEFWDIGIITHINSCEKKYNEVSQIRDMILKSRKKNRVDYNRKYYLNNKDLIIKRSKCRAYFNNTFSFSVSRDGDNRSEYTILKTK